jgi:hypothetical protein
MKPHDIAERSLPRPTDLSVKQEHGEFYIV